uniref:Uncharacterized protein n=1 Tax=Panagrolaimus sp. ES5 TaxID=591445 RepID=A0AC34F3F0_9BILA
MCQNCPHRNLESAEILDTRIPIAYTDVAKTYYAPGELATMKAAHKRPSAFEPGKTPPSSDDEETRRFGKTPKSSQRKKNCPSAPKANRIRKIYPDEDYEDDEEETAC